jgi:hypothetical protein
MEYQPPTGDNTDKTLQTVGQIDSQIQDIYNNLEALNVKANPDINKQNQMLQKIQELETLKSSLFKSVSDNYATAQSNVSISRNGLVNEMAISGIVGSELQNIKQNLNAIKNTRDGKLRMAEINNYYSEKYYTQTNVMKTIVYFCVPILILGILLKKELIPSNIALVLMAVLIGIAIVVVFFQVRDIMIRDNMVFSEYKFPFDPDSARVNNTGNDLDQPVKIDMSLTCVGDACCPTGNIYGTVWDATNKQCVTPSYKDSQTEGFVGEKCVKNSFSNSDFKVNMFNNNNTVSGYSENNNYAKF